MSLGLKQITNNIFGGWMYYVLTVASGLVLTPFLVSKLGMSAYGLLSVGTTFFLCLELLQDALNSMTGRFMIVAINSGDEKSAEEYFNSALFSALFLLLPISLGLTAIVVFRNSLFNIPAGQSGAFLLLLIFACGTFLMKFGSAQFACAFFVSNRIDLKNVLNSVAKIVYIVAAPLLIVKVSANVGFVAAAEFMGGAVICFGSVWAWRRFLPQIKIGLQFFRRKHLKELLLSGVWYSINNVNGILFNAIDIYIANLFFPGQEGIVAIAKAFPGYFYSMMLVVRNAFAPSFVYVFARYDSREIHESLSVVSRVMIFLGSIVLAGWGVWGMAFLKLWLPKEDCTLMFWLTSGLFLPYVFSLSLQYYLSIYIAANSMRKPAIFFFALGAAKVLTTILLIRYTRLGIWSIIVSSAGCNLIRDFGFAIYYIGKLLSVKVGFFLRWSAFGIVDIALLYGVFFAISRLGISSASWLGLGINAVIALLAGGGINALLHLFFSRRAKRGCA